jgi:hypothetical protein
MRPALAVEEGRKSTRMVLNELEFIEVDVSSY